MDSRKTSKAFDIQNDDDQINLQFQDFGDNTSNIERDDEVKGMTVFFDSFPDSAIDDQEEKLLENEDGNSSRKSTHSFWTFEYYQQFFDVESRQVGDRIIWSMVPKPGVNFLQSYIRPNPDLYGPFWICITLVLITGVAGNLSSYLQSSEPHNWRYDFHKVTLATSSIFFYAWLVPLLIFGVLYWRGSRTNISLLELICLYGYSLAIFVPVSLLWIIPLRWLQWCLGIVASVLSGSVLVRTIQPAISHEAKKVALGLAVLILVLHAALALGFMLYFFYPSAAANSAPIEGPQIAKANGSQPVALNKEGPEISNKQAKEEEKEKENGNIDKEKSKDRESKSVNRERAIDQGEGYKKNNNEKEDLNKIEKSKVTSKVMVTERVDRNKGINRKMENISEVTSKILTSTTGKIISNNPPIDRVKLPPNSFVSPMKVTS